MDCLALEVVVDRVCAGANGLPAWIGEADAAIVNAALDAHKARFRTPDPAKKNDYDLRRQTRDAWQGLKSAALQNGLDENQAEQLRRAFSIRYNALSVNGKERRALAVGLWSKLHTPGRARLAALSAIRDFIDNQDVARLHNALAV
jgi:hypothetical protein